MLLNDNEYSLETISQKTNITIENLQKLANKEWDKFKRPHALGLISIIEREFKVDLSDLKEEALEYYNSHQPKDVDRPIDLVDAATVSGGGSKWVNNIITVITLCALGYAGWYYFVDHEDSNVTEQNSSHAKGMFENTIDKAKELLGNKQVEINSSSVKNSAQIKTTAIKQEPKEDTEPKELALKEQKNKSEPIKQDSIKEPKDEPKQKFNIVENNSTTLENKEEKNSSITVVTKQNSAELNNTKEENSTKPKQVFSLTDTNKSQDAKENSTKEQVVVEYNSSNAQDLNSSENNQTVANITEATFKLKSKRLWVGIYNLNSGKRVSKTLRRPYKLNIGSDKYAIITGHNAFEIVTNNGVKTFDKKGKVYFVISANGIEQIDKKEYRKLTKRRAW